MADNARIDELLGVVLMNPDRHRQRHYFDMRTNGFATIGQLAEECETTACLAGHSVLLFGDRKMTLRECRARGNVISDLAARLLRLNGDQAHAIFYCMDEGQAIAMLKHVKDNPAATGYELYAATEDERTSRF
jgi:hypothetical protein